LVDGDLSAGAFGGALAVAAALTALPAGAAWLVWRWAPQREQLRVTAFLITLVGIAAVLIGRAVAEAKEQKRVIAEQARALAQQMVAREPRPPASRAPGEQERSSAATPVSSSAKAVVAAQRALKAKLDAVQLAYDLAADAVAPATFFDLAGLDSAEAIAARRARVQAFARANRLLREAADLGAHHLSSELRDHAISEEGVREAVAVYRRATKKQLPLLKRLRDADGALALHMEAFLDFAQQQLGQWRPAPRPGEHSTAAPASVAPAFVFSSPEAAERYADFAGTAAALAAQRSAVLAELAAATR
jgi:hypothetical protein